MQLAKPILKYREADKADGGKRPRASLGRHRGSETERKLEPSWLTNTYIHISIHACIQTYKQPGIQAIIHIYTHTHTYTHTNIYTYIEATRQTSIHPTSHTHIHTETGIHTDTHTERHTYIYRNIKSGRALYAWFNQCKC